MQIVFYLARSKKIVPSSELSKYLLISQRRTLQITGTLRDAGLIVTHTGMTGGYSLNKDPSSISAYTVISLMEGDMRIPDCLVHVPDCSEPCKNSNLFDTMNPMKEYIDSYLKTITFDKLAAMEINGKLTEILALVEIHIAEMKQKS